MDRVTKPCDGRCGLAQVHNFWQCPGSRCRLCNQTGHWAKYCPRVLGGAPVVPVAEISVAVVPAVEVPAVEVPAVEVPVVEVPAVEWTPQQRSRKSKNPTHFLRQVFPSQVNQINQSSQSSQ